MFVVCVHSKRWTVTLKWDDTCTWCNSTNANARIVRSRHPSSLSKPNQAKPIQTKPKPSHARIIKTQLKWLLTCFFIRLIQSQWVYKRCQYAHTHTHLLAIKTNTVWLVSHRWLFFERMIIFFPHKLRIRSTNNWFFPILWHNRNWNSQNPKKRQKQIESKPNLIQIDAVSLQYWACA